MTATVCAEPEIQATRLLASKPVGSRGPAVRDKVAAYARIAWGLLVYVIGWAPVTWVGAFAAVTIYYWLLPIYGYGRNDRILLAIGLCGLGLIGLMVGLVILTALWLRFRKDDSATEPLNFEAGQPCRTGYRIGWIAWNPLIKIELAWDDPAGAKVELIWDKRGPVEEVTASQRALRREVVRRFRITDVLGLAQFSFRRRSAQPLTIKPSCGRVNRIELLQQNIPGDALCHPDGKPQGDLIEMRRYSPGDPLKLVLWKVYGRTGRMMVRMPEKAIAPCEKTLAYLVTSEADEPAAGIARALLENGSLGNEFVFGAEGIDTTTRNVHEAVELVIRSANARTNEAVGLASFLERGEVVGVKACLLFVPGKPGPWLDQVAERVAHHSGPCRVLVGTDGIETSRRSLSFCRFLMNEQPGTVGNASDLRMVCDRLANAGAQVCIVDRVSGQNSHSTELPSS